MTGFDSCQACGRADVELTRHHLIPTSQHKRVLRRCGMSRKELQQKTIVLCRDCHGQLHALVSEKELAENFSTLEAIKAHPDFSRFVEWVRGRKGSFGHHLANVRKG